ncbi:DUF481 domain-containing protein [Pontibacter sp. 172403-2]|uniref:DUF481 domain-containing protein n=1 Tax=Pontibacter rufus TaxID=2791028 RepID=UPI0018B006A9|nr:DUF481 domain-containing protein [Pontibacter sp. 172403-2]MBF9253854.1 DUF481 domain-containing protein [Pontibacter sp. 172403-2]
MQLHTYKLIAALSFSFCLASFFAANAQILNIERARVEQDSANYLTGKLGINFSVYNQNAGKNNPNNYLQFTFNGDLAYVSPQNSYLLINNYNYLLVNFTSEEQRNTVASTGYAHFRVNFLRKRKLSYELFAQVQADKARGLELRTLAGGGLRIAVLRGADVSVYAGTGLMHEHEEWRNLAQEGSGYRIADLVKSTNYISTKAKLSEQLSTEGIVYYQFGYDNNIARMRNRVSGDVSLNVKLNSKFAFRTSFNCTFENRPIVPVTKFVYALTNGIQMQF